MVTSWVLRVSHEPQVLKNLIHGPLNKVPGRQADPLPGLSSMTMSHLSQLGHHHL